MDISNISLIGDRILIRLDEQPEHSTTKEGIIVPIYRPEETEGGKIKGVLSSEKYLAQGTVIAISPYSKGKLEDLGVSLSPGDPVYPARASVSPSYAFPLDRSTLIASFDGIICIPHSLLEAKIINGNQENTSKSNLPNG